MKKFSLPTLVICVMTLYSCSDVVQQRRIGDWDDNIKLSTKAVEFNSNGDSITIKTGGDWWWVASISVNDTHYSDFKNVNRQSSNYSIKEDCFIFNRVDKNTIFIKVDRNPLATNRIIKISLQAGDYFDGIKITQNSNEGN